MFQLIIYAHSHMVGWCFVAPLLVRQRQIIFVALWSCLFFHLSIAFFSLSLRSKPSMRTKIAWFCNKNKFCIDTWVLLGELSFDWSVSLYVQHTRAYHVNFTNIGHGNDFYVINTFLFAFFFPSLFPGKW